MKRIFLFIVIAFSITVSAQVNIDTVLVRNLTMQAQDWAWFVGKNASTTDSTSISAIRRIRNKVQQSVPQAWSTNVTVDSLPGTVVISMYGQLNVAPAGEIAARYGAIKTAISAKLNLAYWIGFIDAQGPTEFDRKRGIGKNILIDN
jgi:hypothetical protein